MSSCQCVIMSVCHYCHLHIVVRVLQVVFTCKSCHLWFWQSCHLCFLSMCFEVVFIFWSMLFWVFVVRSSLHGGNVCEVVFILSENVKCCQQSVKFVSVCKCHLYIIDTIPVVSPCAQIWRQICHNQCTGQDRTTLIWELLLSHCADNGPPPALW